jgi:hypothetical protein
MRTPSNDEIAGRAYELFQRRGGEAGHDLEDWLEAERQLSRSPRGKANEAQRSQPDSGRS